MGKYIGRIYKHIQSQLLTQSIKAPNISSLACQTSSFIESTITSVLSVIYKNKPIMFCVPKIPSRMI